MASAVHIAVAAVVVHAVLFISIFDIYFTSPIDQGMVPQYYRPEPPAKRLVLFVADGLRADTIFSLDKDGNTAAPFLRKTLEYDGRWGVSHTHVPTESRPGHVALIAGFYEDVSAVATGWQENPVEFDSLFNQSHHTWAWGSPDILPMFAQGAVPGRVETFMYDAVWEDFADSDPSKLDTWVFEKVEEMFLQARVDSQLREMLSKEKIVFFLHLLGIDTNGHAHRPTSPDVINNLKLVDKGIQKITNLIDSYYDDGKTAYVFTSDHGMTDWGSHGAGLPNETMTPLICWGAGLKHPRSNTHAEYVYHDGYSEKWKLDKYERVDVEQADIASLMATLIGVPIPLNSEGVLPLGYIHYNKGFCAESLFSNARQLLEQLRVKGKRIHANSLPFTFRPFPKLTAEEVTEKTLQIHELIKIKRFQHAIDLCYKLIDLSKEGVRYYHTYHRFFLKLVVTLGFFGWILCTLITILVANVQLNVRYIDRQTYHFPYMATLLTFSVWLLLLYQSSPLFYYLYYTITILCWRYVWNHRNVLRHSWQLALHNPAQMFRGAAAILFTVCGLELLVLSFFFREVLSVLLLLVALWPYFTELVRRDMKLCVSWTVTCLLLAVFPLLPVIGRAANYSFVVISGLVAVAVTVSLLSSPQRQYALTTPNSSVFQPAHLLKVQTALLAVSSFIPALTNWFFSRKETIPPLIHVFCWTTLLVSVFAPHFGSRSLLGRLLHIALSLYTVFLLLSTSFEAIFVLLLCAILYLWLSTEESLAARHSKITSVWESIISFHKPKVVTLLPNETHRNKNSASFDDVRRVGFCLFFGILSFFGIGNIASVNTFDPSTVYCFLTVFSPFVMGALILWKMIIPFIFVSSTYNCIMSLLNQQLKTSLLLILVMSDVMGVNFFFLVRDSGSWLEIGVSISHYVIVMTMSIGVVVLMGVARVLTGVAVVPRKIEDHLF